jgi:4-hydroxyacetophenone monooxygenase
MVLVHMTGDRRWVQDPYRPTRPRGTADNDSGGLPLAVQQEVRDAAFAALTTWRDGGAPPPPPPAHELFVEMMGACVGEAVAEAYAPMMAEEMGFVPRELGWKLQPADDDFRVLVIGAGISGICVAIKLEHVGIAYQVIEKNSAVGGTWHENRYPGCGVDTPSHLYSFSFEPNHGWSEYYAKRGEILAYLERCAARHGVSERIRYETEVVGAAYDSATSRWSVVLRTADGGEETVECNILISAVGQLNRPKIPAIEGIEAFRGPAFHSACWPEDLDLTGKRVAVVGTGASAMQIVPAIVDEVDELVVFQRSPQWAAPNENYRRRVSDEAQLLLTWAPFYAAWYRFRLLWMFNDKVHASLQIDPEWEHLDRSVNATNDSHRRFFTDYIKSELGDRTDLLAKVLPDYPPFGKRMLIDNGWFRTMTRENVELVTDAVVEVTPTGVLTAAGKAYAVDVIVFATGFDALRLLAPMEIRGRSGRTLRDLWGVDDARAYLGIGVPDFPNFFCLYGPNTNLGHGGSIIFHTECQVGYALALIREMRRRGMSAVEVRHHAWEEYNRRVDEAHERMIWTHPGMETWYRNARGRVVTNSPWRLVDYWRMTREPDLNDFDVELAPDRVPETVKPVAAGASGPGV